MHTYGGTWGRRKAVVGSRWVGVEFPSKKNDRGLANGVTAIIQRRKAFLWKTWKICGARVLPLMWTSLDLCLTVTLSTPPPPPSYFMMLMNHMHLPKIEPTNYKISKTPRPLTKYHHHHGQASHSHHMRKKRDEPAHSTYSFYNSDDIYSARPSVLRQRRRPSTRRRDREMN